MSRLHEALRSLDEAITSGVRQLTEAARLDDATPLLNSVALAEDSITLFASVDTSYAIMFGDMNGLKALNGRHGAQAGDAVIREIGKKLNSLADECAARAYHKSGDEFVLLVPASERITDIADHIAHELRSVSTLYKATRIVTSVGFGCAQGDEGYGVLLERAEAACMMAKEAGGGVVHWSPNLEPKLPINKRPEKCSKCGTKFDCWVPRIAWNSKLCCPCCGSVVLDETGPPV